MEKHISNLYDLVLKMESRMPIEHIQLMILSYIYVDMEEKMNNHSNNAEVYNYASNVVKERFPVEFIIDLKEILDNSSMNEIKDIVFAVTQLESRFIDKTNDNLSKLIINLLELKNGDKLFDMGSGSGAFLANVVKREKKDGYKLAEILGVEINISQVYMSIMAIELLSDKHARKISIDYSNILIDPIKQTYNKGYSFAPFGMRVSGGNTNFKTIFKDVELTAKNSSELIFIDRLLKNLKGEKRRAVVLVQGRVLFNHSDRAYRNALVKSGLLEGIIELPNNVHHNTSIKSFLLIFSDSNYKVKFVNATNLVLKQQRYTTDVDVEAILSLYRSDKALCIPSSELLDVQNWIPSNILLDVYEPDNGIPLSEVAEVFTGSQYTQKRFSEMFTEDETGYKILTSSDIEDGLINYEKLKSFVPEDGRYDKFAVKTNDLIITSKSSIVKMVVIDNIKDEKIIVTGGMIIVRPNPDKLNSTYLKIILESKYGQNVIKSIQKGLVIVTINAKSLAGILISLPDIHYQNQIANKYNTKLATLLAYKKEISNIEDDLKNFYYEEIGGKYN